MLRIILGFSPHLQHLMSLSRVIASEVTNLLIMDLHNIHFDKRLRIIRVDCRMVLRAGVQQKLNVNQTIQKQHASGPIATSIDLLLSIVHLM